jgi:hypothetical protein
VSIQENYNPLSGNPTTQNTVVTDRSLRLSILLASAFVLAVVLPWWNHYIGVTNDAWHYFGGQQILEGKVPYRDFYLFVTPLGPLKNALLIALFGNHISRQCCKPDLALAWHIFLGVPGWITCRSCCHRLRLS